MKESRDMQKKPVTKLLAIANKGVQHNSHVRRTMRYLVRKNAELWGREIPIAEAELYQACFRRR